jgi:hypothetical protein
MSARFIVKRANSELIEPRGLNLKSRKKRKRRRRKKKKKKKKKKKN